MEDIKTGIILAALELIEESKDISRKRVSDLCCFPVSVKDFEKALRELENEAEG